jgi:hypothetical protein
MKIAVIALFSTKRNMNIQSCQNDCINFYKDTALYNSCRLPVRSRDTKAGFLIADLIDAAKFQKLVKYMALHDKNNFRKGFIPKVPNFLNNFISTG